MATLYKEFVLNKSSIWPFVVAFIRSNAASYIEKGRPLRLIVTAEEKKRTPEQNAFYFGVVLRDVAEQVWVDGQQFSQAAWHEMLAEEFAPREEIKLPGGKLFNRRKSTSDMSVSEFSEYTTKVQAYVANEFGVSFDGGVHA